MTPDRVLAIFAHPDDESIVAGGTLAACAAAGLDTIILCVTRGEQGPIAHTDLATRQTLGAVREAELRAAAKALSVATVECRGYADGDLESADKTALMTDIRHVLQRWRPDAVITFGPEGLYWHPDHIAVHDFTMAVLDSMTDDGFSPWVYHATYPKGRMAELASAMARRGLATNLWNLDPDDFGVRPSLITTVVDVRSFLVPKLRALRSHRSQLDADHLFQVMPDDIAGEFLGHEYFVRVRPRKATGDWLADIVSGRARGRTP